MNYDLKPLKNKPKGPKYTHDRWIFNHEKKLKKSYVELVKYMAQDKTYKEIAEIKKTHLGRIFGMVENLMNHLGLRKRTSLVIWALKNNYLKLEDL